jgi:hypothetical protein
VEYAGPWGVTCIHIRPSLGALSRKRVCSLSPVALGHEDTPMPRGGQLP